jgi:glycosyltransferase involved in cell wall biosynthesis
MKVRRSQPLSSRPSVSVVIPCYRYGHYLPDAINAAFDQDGVDVEVVIVDDASPDDSGDVAEQLAAADSRIRVVRHRRNMGHIATYNDGLKTATADFVTLVSADDLLAPGALARAVSLMIANPDVGFVYGRPIEFTGQPPGDLGRASAHFWTIWDGHSWIRLSCRRGRNFILSPEVVMRTSAVRDVGDYRPDLPHSGDLELWLRTASRWNVGRINGPVQAYYRVHDANMHLTTFAGLVNDIRHRHNAFKSLQAGLIPDPDRHIALAGAALATQALVGALHLLDQGTERHIVQPLIDVAGAICPAMSDGQLATKVRHRSARRRPAALARYRLVDSIRWRTWRLIGIS